MAAGSYLGAGLSSVVIYIIAARGWRASFMYTGLVGLVISILSYLLIKEPKSNIHIARHMKKSES